MKTITKSIVVEYNSIGEIVNVFDIKTLSMEQIDEMKNKAKVHKALEEKEKSELQEQIAKEKEIQLEKDYRRSIVIAKLQFDANVDKGLSETTNEFEEHYNRFILGDKFEESKAPIDFLTILERIK